MKRNTLIAVVLCLIMITTAGAGTASAKKENPRQADESSIYFYDVEATDTHGKGKLVIDVKHHTFVFIGQDFEPSGQIALRTGDADSDIFATGKATPSGNLHISGTWEEEVAAEEVVAGTYYAPIWGFILWNEGWFFTRIACDYSTDGGVTWQESGHTVWLITAGDYTADLDDLGVPMYALVKIHVIVDGGKDKIGSQVFQYSSNYGYRDYAEYWIEGTTFKHTLIYFGVNYEIQ